LIYHRTILVFLVLWLFHGTIFCQPPEDRYTNAIFTNITETNGVQFSTGVPQPNPGGGFYEFITGLPLNVDEFDTDPVDLKMDIFEPQGDTVGKRPLVIIAFGGGFLTGERAGANQYKIDPDQIYIGGHSAGAFIALHNAYLENESERPLSTYAWTQDGTPIPDLQCLDCVGDNLSFSGHANAIFSLAGGIGDVNYIESSNDKKLVMFHSEDDGTVPYDSGEPFGSLLLLVVGDDLPISYGSLPISNRCNDIGLPYEFNSYTDRGHGVHEETNTTLYDDIIPGISNWFFTQELQPIYDTLYGHQTVCTDGLEHTYTLPNGNGTYFDWLVTGGTFLQTSPYSTAATVLWDANATDHSLTVVPYSELDARGDSITLNLNIENSAINQYIGTDSSWSNPNNWSLTRTPLPCDDVQLSGSMIDVNISDNTLINSLLLTTTNELTIGTSASLLIQQKNLTFNSEALNLEGSIINYGDLQIDDVNLGQEVKLLNQGILRNFGTIEIGKD